MDIGHRSHWKLIHPPFTNVLLLYRCPDGKGLTHPAAWLERSPVLFQGQGQLSGCSVHGLAQHAALPHWPEQSVASASAPSLPLPLPCLCLCFSLCLCLCLCTCCPHVSGSHQTLSSLGTSKANILSQVPAHQSSASALAIPGAGTPAIGVL